MRNWSTSPLEVRASDLSKLSALVASPTAAWVYHLQLEAEHEVVQTASNKAHQSELAP